MSRLMSVALTEDAVVARRKTVTRRIGWWQDKHGRRILKTGDQLTLCRKVMGRKAGDPLIRIAEVEVVDIRRERLDAITPADVRREGFDLPHPPHPADAQWFIEFFTHEMRCTPATLVTRIEWRYIARATETYDCVTSDCGCVPEATRSCPGRLDLGEVTG